MRITSAYKQSEEYRVLKAETKRLFHEEHVSKTNIKKRLSINDSQLSIMLGKRRRRSSCQH
jgi:hypothetical protein